MVVNLGYALEPSQERLEGLVIGLNTQVHWFLNFNMHQNKLEGFLEHGKIYFSNYPQTS